VFESVGWGEIFVLVVAGLFILGPERLPSAAAWLGQTMRQVREYATGARDQLRRELGPEFDELRKPLEDLRGLRDFNPRAAVRRTLFEDDAVGAAAPEKPVGYAFNPSGVGGLNGGGPDESVNGSHNGSVAGGVDPMAARLSPNERPPIDPDAT
jgi:sec-independent protein translocase protein TatB